MVNLVLISLLISLLKIRIPINCSNFDASVLKFVCKLLPNWDELLAVSTPGGIEHDDPWIMRRSISKLSDVVKIILGELDDCGVG